ncbi:MULTISPECIES: pentapeptide repeat-containing protein [unclassified Streptomyces]|uniref:pentapeptide repeat-containing protein n=1 Tax=unclassified Streptomyces TaxID=2593676 RepID=UPI0009A1044E|nr:pentapeptide repeat-containing protein [Streptomyces sp. TSRI0107]
MDACLAHVDGASRAAYLATLGPGADIDLRGTAFTEELLDELFDAVRDPATGNPTFGNVLFDNATFSDVADFDHTSFRDIAVFNDVTFREMATFYGATFSRSAWFQGATFASLSNFDQVTFCREAQFDRAKFNIAFFFGSRFSRRAEFKGARLGAAAFEGAKFRGAANFPGATFNSAEFQKATFDGPANFQEATFGSAEFQDATFAETTEFKDAKFSEDAWFSGATFSGPTSFIGETTFSADAIFGAIYDTTDGQESKLHCGATFEGSTSFDGVTFPLDAWFNETTFRADAKFSKATFSGQCVFDDARFGTARFSEATFARYAQFKGTRFSADAHFSEARFESERKLGPLTATGAIHLRGAVFVEPVTVHAAAAQLVCSGARFEGPATLHARYADVDLSEAVLSQPTTVTSTREPVPPENDLLPEERPLASTRGTATASITSLRRVDTALLVLTNLDLSRCAFNGAHHLDQLRLEGECTFASPPKSLRWRGVPFRWTQRQVLAEEHHWRALEVHHAAKRNGWTKGPAHRHPGQTPGPATLGVLYRQLRKSFEDNKDEPGAADFYYGEMEMRRHDRSRSSPAERGLLHAYWVLSGYGLRASRALAWLILAMATTVFALMLWGLPNAAPKPHVTGTQPRAGQPVALTVDTPAPILAGPLRDRITGARAGDLGVQYEQDALNTSRSGCRLRPGCRVRRSTPWVAVARSSPTACRLFPSHPAPPDHQSQSDPATLKIISLGVLVLTRLRPDCGAQLGATSSLKDVSDLHRHLRVR